MNKRCATWVVATQMVAVAVLLLCDAPAIWAQGKVDEKLMQRYGGVLAPECGNYLLPHLLYLAILWSCATAARRC